MFGHLLAGAFPSACRHLAALEVDAAAVLMHWFLAIYVNALPLETCLRVWDLFFLERSAVVLFRVALALVDIYHQVGVN